MELPKKIQFNEISLQRLHSPEIEKRNLTLSVLRLDKIHPQISGNKYFKLKYNTIEAQKQGQDTLLTFGGAYSNHIYATAEAAKLLGFKSIGIIRGEPTHPLNPTLAYAQECGMRLQFISRVAYKDKQEANFQAQLQEQWGDFYLIPEGGSNVWALVGVQEIVSLIKTDFDFIATSCGTGATMAGLMLGISEGQQVLGFSALKGGDFLWQEMKSLLMDYFKQFNHKVSANSIEELMAQRGKLFLDYHFGGYAKKTPELLDFIATFTAQHSLLVEWIYTGKLFYALFDLIQKDYFPVGSKIIALHTGGLRVDT